VEQFLDLACIGPDDVVCDLGCGDGRVLIAAARRGARGVGLDFSPQLVQRAREKAEAAGEEVSKRVEVHEADIASDLARTLLRSATVVFLFMLPTTMAFMQSLLFSECGLSSSRDRGGGDGMRGDGGVSSGGDGSGSSSSSSSRSRSGDLNKSRVRVVTYMFSLPG
jgi:SAM-dependent methyltransferase